MSRKIVVGIPSYNEGENIGFVAGQVDKGLQKYFKDHQAVIINCDGNSTDGTVEHFLSAQTKTEKMVLRKKGLTGKGNVFKQLFRYIKKHGARYCIVVDADLKSIKPVWVKYMIEPLEKGYDYVTPFYSRHKYDGTITNNICYPLVYALLGKNIRQPIGGDFSFSGELAGYWLDQKWIKAINYFGIDIFMTISTIRGGYKTAQVNLGSKIHKPSAPNLNVMFLQVCDSLFHNLGAGKIEETIRVKKSRMFGLKKLARPQSLSFDDQKIKRDVLDEYRTHLSTIRKVLPDNHFETISSIFKTGEPVIGSGLWCRLVYDCVAAYRSQKKDAIKTLQILYFGRVYSFIQETRSMSQAKAELEILEQAKVFRKNRKYLIEKLK
ncbi:MAG: glycosyltransferase [bacterium]|jgi:hypothetical protein|nr:glycosyltransferase [bacterium]